MEERFGRAGHNYGFYRCGSSQCIRGAYDCFEFMADVVYLIDRLFKSDSYRHLFNL